VCSLTSSTDGEQRWIAAGRIGRPHGLDGSFHVTGAKPRLLSVGTRLRVGVRGASLLLQRRSGTDRDPIVSVEGVEDRDAVLSLRGSDLLVAVEDAPSLPEGEWWAHELEGCEVRDGAAIVGTVERLLELPSCEALEVARPDRGSLLVPMVKEAIRSVDMQARRIDVDLAFLGEPEQPS